LVHERVHEPWVSPGFHGRRHPAAASTQVEQADVWRGSLRTAGERVAAEAEIAHTARTTSTLDRLTVEGALTTEQRLALANDTRSDQRHAPSSSVFVSAVDDLPSPLRAFVELKIGGDVCEWVERQRKAEPHTGELSPDHVRLPDNRKSVPT
jgi:hypothetical protein